MCGHTDHCGRFRTAGTQYTTVCITGTRNSFYGELIEPLLEELLVTKVSGRIHSTRNTGTPSVSSGDLQNASADHCIIQLVFGSTLGHEE